MSKTHNPYLNAAGEPIVGSAAALPIVATTRAGTQVRTGTPLVANNGELNASNNAEALKLIAQLLQASAEGGVRQSLSAAAGHPPVDKNAVHAGLLNAFHANTGNDFAVYGEEIANTVKDTAARAGVLRRFMPERQLTTQEIAKTRYRRHLVNGITLGPNSAVTESRHDSRFIFPEEVTIAARPIINEKDLYQEGQGLLDEKAEDALEQVMCVEDRGLRNMFLRAVGYTNQQLAFSSFTPSVFSTLKQMVENTGGLPVNDAWMSNVLWTDINSGQSEFSDWFSPIAKHELVLTGKVGTLMECTISTDAHLEGRLRVLQRGEVFFVARADFLGETLLRQPLTSSEISGANDGEAWRGWFIRQILAVSLANTRGVSHGFKL